MDSDIASALATLLFGLVGLLVFLGVCFVIFLVIRQFVLWYWRINETANHVAYIAQYLRESNLADNLAYLANLERRAQRQKMADGVQPDFRQPGMSG